MRDGEGPQEGRDMWWRKREHLGVRVGKACVKEGRKEPGQDGKGGERPGPVCAQGRGTE